MVVAVRDPRSIGIRTYVERLAVALAEVGVEYLPASRPDPEAVCHFHLANSTRAVLPYAARHRRAFLVTVHDVIPRARALRPLHRAVVVPACVRRASRLIVHSRHAAGLLAHTAGVAESQVDIVPHPAPVPRSADRAAARRALALVDPEGFAALSIDGPPLFVLPGTLKGAKLVRETLCAAGPLLAGGRAQLLLAGHVTQETLAREATAAGALLLRDPDEGTYEHAIVAADVVLCLRAGTVGESNGPLLDAIGAGRPSLVTNVGSGPEVAGDSARVVASTAPRIRTGLEALLDQDERDSRACAARARAAELTWEHSARRHLELLSELGVA